MSDRPELLDYLVFFESEPEILYPGTGWYCGSKFVSNRGDDHIVAVVAPDEGEFAFQWWQNDLLRADFNIAKVIEWNLECSSKREILFLKFGQDGNGFFSLQLKPTISVSWISPW
ncbi:hypothetical protein [Collimonas sp. PA-H2]|uniref:hypothetical protein n=1 Tax=Collimonas sp. PA-H2 TaxID=1881062 RepID=UPI00118129A6|nr:hypothetical protein [Collimonas sp. PA-H2]